MANQDFAGQQEGEEVNFIIRHHRSMMTGGIVRAIIIAGVSFVPLLFWMQYGWVWYIALVGVGIGGMVIFNTWLKWYYSVFIVTNLRIRQQSQQNLFRKTTLDLYLNKVQNISYNIKGLQGSLLGYGTIVLQTVVGDMVMTKIANCEETYNQLSAAIQLAGGQTEQGEYDDTEDDIVQDND